MSGIAPPGGPVRVLIVGAAGRDFHNPAVRHPVPYGDLARPQPGKTS